MTWDFQTPPGEPRPQRIPGNPRDARHEKDRHSSTFTLDTAGSVVTIKTYETAAATRREGNRDMSIETTAIRLKAHGKTFEVELTNDLTQPHTTIAKLLDSRQRRASGETTYNRSETRQDNETELITIAEWIHGQARIEAAMTCANTPDELVQMLDAIADQLDRIGR